MTASGTASLFEENIKQVTKYYLENKQIAVIRKADTGIYTSKSMADMDYGGRRLMGEDVVKAEFAGKLYTE